MCSTIWVGDVIGEAKHAFVVRIVVLDRDFDPNGIGFIIRVRDFFTVNRFAVQHAFVFVEMRDEFGDATFVIKIVALLFFAACAKKPS